MLLLPSQMGWSSSPEKGPACLAGLREEATERATWQWWQRRDQGPAQHLASTGRGRAEKGGRHKVSALHSRERTRNEPISKADGQEELLPQRSSSSSSLTPPAPLHSLVKIIPKTAHGYPRVSKPTDRWERKRMLSPRVQEETKAAIQQGKSSQAFSQKPKEVGSLPLPTSFG